MIIPVPDNTLKMSHITSDSEVVEEALRQYLQSNKAVLRKVMELRKEIE